MGPLVGVTLDSEAPGGWSAYPWYAVRVNYLDALAGSGARPIALPHLPDLADGYAEAIEALVVTGGAFDVDPALYGDGARHRTVTLKQRRTQAELALIHATLARDKPVLGICGGQQLLAVALGGTLIQHIPDESPEALGHEQVNPRHEPGHEVAIRPGTLLARITGAVTLPVNSAHHQAVRDPGRAIVNAEARDGIIEGIEWPGARFCLGVQWHPEFLVSSGDRAILDALVAAARG